MDNNKTQETEEKLSTKKTRKHLPFNSHKHSTPNYINPYRSLPIDIKGVSGTSNSSSNKITQLFGNVGYRVLRALDNQDDGHPTREPKMLEDNYMRYSVSTSLQRDRAEQRRKQREEGNQGPELIDSSSSFNLVQQEKKYNSTNLDEHGVEKGYKALTQVFQQRNEKKKAPSRIDTQGRKYTLLLPTDRIYQCYKDQFRYFLNDDRALFLVSQRALQVPWPSINTTVNFTDGIARKIIHAIYHYKSNGKDPVLMIACMPKV